ncbi:MAG: hypothetical protein ACLP50_23265 [Solirubrobacteraceae bacterium]
MVNDAAASTVGTEPALAPVEVVIAGAELELVAAGVDVELELLLPQAAASTDTENAISTIAIGRAVRLLLITIAPCPHARILAS